MLKYNFQFVKKKVEKHWNVWSMILLNIAQLTFKKLLVFYKSSGSLKAFIARSAISTSTHLLRHVSAHFIDPDIVQRRTLEWKRFSHARIWVNILSFLLLPCQREKWSNTESAFFISCIQLMVSYAPMYLQLFKNLSIFSEKDKSKCLWAISSPTSAARSRFRLLSFLSGYLIHDFNCNGNLFCINKL